MKVHIGCGRTLIPGFINVDNSPSALLAKCNKLILALFKKASLINEEQMEFALELKRWKKEFLRSDCLKMPIKNDSAEICYSSHMIGWSLSHDQLMAFIRELHRILKPGGGLRLSFMDFDQLVREFQEHKNTILFSKYIPPFGLDEATFRNKLKFLISPNLQNGMVLNGPTLQTLLESNGFRDVHILPAGATSLPADLLGEIDLSERAYNSVYVECRKA
jgi:SAM-dependent methyltransferase